MATDARPASTVVLLRPSPTRFDVCLVRRPDEVAFMGGAYVFPGGRVDTSDYLADPGACCEGVDAAVARMRDVRPADAIAHHVAAVRELFEEAGVLLESGALAAACTGVSDRRSVRDAYRRELADGRTSLCAMAQREGFRLALDALTMFAHWRTPETENARYDVRFFLARAPEGQEPFHDGNEIAAAMWLDPAAAIERCRRREIALPPPTWTTLRSLERFRTIDDVLAWGSHRTVTCIQPNLVKGENRTFLTLPGDPLYPGTALHEPIAETRFVLEDGRWRPSEL